MELYEIVNEMNESTLTEKGNYFLKVIIFIFFMFLWHRMIYTVNKMEKL